ncbi:hypothetical protein A2Z23_02240 [Candidatus Curtissbacteria bacterium RBG_16_39_7]|uniref:Uncharacterized protein n=1 Tax=Candidatus Curtissbacteria bacterium RBG_16_39_7 TaxID=1797707 RepID=A0A1F5G2S4_9BACT|nr:MAG: hypothetical protein A2Z23_02240 [Candidatus Curtissbacteria bacterium RBG_16_39_7]
MNDLFVLAQRSIDEALSSNWEGAIATNQEILRQNPNDLEAKNRLARACLEIGKVGEAKKIYQEVLKADSYNQIALKNFQRITKLNGNLGNGKSGNNHQLNSTIFLSEPGKAKLVNLIHLANPQEISSLSPGEQLRLQPKKHTVCVFNKSDQYVGALPDDISHLLISLIDGGNIYEAYVKKTSINCLQVILWEKYRSERFISQPSFLETRKINYYPYIKEEGGKIDQGPSPECEEELIEEERSWNKDL